ncbi:MAG: RNA polymerase sigma factor [Anaerolineae bacterium]
MKLIPLRLGPQSLPAAPGAAHVSASGGEAALLARARAGDKVAVAQIYRRYVDEIYGYAYNQLGERQEAEDATSEVFLRLVRALPGFRGDSSLRTWLYTICRNVLRDRWRERASHPSLSLDLMPAGRMAHSDAPSAPEADTEPARAQGSELGQVVLAQLNERERRVLSLRFLDGRSVADAAAELGVSPGNLKVIQHRALRHAERIARSLTAAAGQPLEDLP